MHSFCEVYRGAQIAESQALAGSDLGVVLRRLGLQFEDSRGTRRDDLAANPDELQVPSLENVARLLARGDLFEQAVALLEHALQPGQGAGVAWLDLHEHLVQKPAPQLRSRFDEAEVIRPEERDAEAAGKIERPPPDAVHLDHPPRPVA